MRGLQILKLVGIILVFIGAVCVQVLTRMAQNKVHAVVLPQVAVLVGKSVVDLGRVVPDLNRIAVMEAPRRSGVLHARNSVILSMDL